MNKKLILFLALFIVGLSTSAQKKERPYKCGAVPKSMSDVEFNFKNFGQSFNCKPGERIASIGASNGIREVEIAAFTDSIFWTIQDIDTACLNTTEFGNVLAYHEKLIGKSIKGDFKIVIGDLHRTNLQQNYYDRVIMSYVYHELADKESIMADIRRSLNSKGVLVIMEDVAKKIGQKRFAGIP